MSCQKMVPLEKLHKELIYAIKSRVFEFGEIAADRARAIEKRRFHIVFINECIEEAAKQFLYLIESNTSAENEITFLASTVRYGLHEITLGDLDRRIQTRKNSMPWFWMERIIAENKDTKIRRWHYSQIMNEEFWVKNISDEIVRRCDPEFKHPNLFRPNSADTIPLVEWSLGTIDLYGLKSALKPISKQWSMICEKNVAGLEIRESERIVGMKLAKAQHRFVRFKDLDGSKIVISKNDYIKVLDKIWPDDANDEVAKSENAVDLILQLKGNDPSLTKTQIKDQHFQNLSHRKFLGRWEQAAEIMPDISAPGRKPA